MSRALIAIYVASAACMTTSGTAERPATPRCGDGMIQAGEQGDGGGESATCTLDCTISRCGDSKVNAQAGEQCDRGAANADNTDCTSACRINVCGDGVDDTVGPDHIEACDDGNKVNTDGCSNACELAGCGNGVLDPGEQCDDGDTDNGDGCSSA